MAKKILVVDDEPRIATLLASRLKANGYDVTIAMDGMQAKGMAHKLKPDLIIMDIKMPAGSGIEVFASLSESVHTATIPVIFVSALAGENIREKILKIGGADFISKPFESEELLHKVKKALGELDERREISGKGPNIFDIKKGN